MNPIRIAVRGLVRVARTCSVRDAVNHESKRRNSRYTFAVTAVMPVEDVRATQPAAYYSVFASSSATALLPVASASSIAVKPFLSFSAASASWASNVSTALSRRLRLER